jgi:hypothetical protein
MDINIITEKMINSDLFIILNLINTFINVKSYTIINLYMVSPFIELEGGITNEFRWNRK